MRGRRPAIERDGVPRTERRQVTRTCVHERGQRPDEQLVVDLALGGVEVRAEHEGRGEQVAPDVGGGLEDRVAITHWGWCLLWDRGRLGCGPRRPSLVWAAATLCSPAGAVKAGCPIVRPCTGSGAEPLSRPYLQTPADRPTVVRSRVRTRWPTVVSGGVRRLSAGFVPDGGHVHRPERTASDRDGPSGIVAR